MKTDDNLSWILNKINRFVDSRWYALLLILLSSVFVLLFSRSTSPLYAYVGFDAACFKQMGMAILNGKTIYIDYIDNKGCLLYFVHALGLWLGGDCIIMIFQAISLTITLLILDKIISFYKNGLSRLLLVLAALVLLACFYEGGDLSEEWSLPFICYPLYVFLKSYNNGNVLKFKDLFAVGVCFGVISFLRINNAIPFCGFLAFVFADYLFKKQWKIFVINMLAFIAGVAIIALPCFMYFYLKAGMEGVNSMIYATYISGFKYITVSLYDPLIIKLTYYSTVILFFAIQLVSSYKCKNFFIPIAISYSLFLVSFGTKTFAHYQIIMVPLYVLCLSTINIQKQWLKIGLLAAETVCLLIFLIKPLGFLYEEVVKGNDKFAKTYIDFHNVMTKNIPEAEKDSIFNYNTSLLGASLLYNENLIQTNPILFTTHTFIDVMKCRPISETKPLWVMVCKSYYSRDDLMFLHDNYDEKFVFHFDIRYYDRFGTELDIYFFRRK